MQDFSVWYGEPAANWVAMPDLPFNATYAGTLAFDGKMFLLGGQSTPDQSAKVLATVDGKTWVEQGTDALPAAWALGSAVVRNRARRRLKEAVRLVAPAHATKGYDYVLIARAGTLQRPFTALTEDLTRALAKVHEPAAVKKR